MKLGDLTGYAESTVAAVANKVSYAGAGAAVYGGLSANEVAAIGGLVVAMFSVLIQWFYKARADRRAVELHRARLARAHEEEEEA
jgi:ABC-type proline/glycine betaine transport system permease subunit